MESRPCDACGAEYTPTRSHSRYCSGPCRQKAYRERLRTPTNDCRYGPEGHDYTDHLIEVPYISSIILEAEKKWWKRREPKETGERRIRRPWA